MSGWELALALVGAFLLGGACALGLALWLARRELRRRLGPLADALQQTASSGSVTVLGRAGGSEPPLTR